MSSILTPNIVAFLEYLGTVALVLSMVFARYILKWRAVDRATRQLLAAKDARWRVTVEDVGRGTSPSWLAMLGHDSGRLELDLQGWLAMAHVDDRALLATELDSLLNGFATSLNAEYRVRCNDGSVRWVQLLGTGGHRPPGSPGPIFSGSHTDITDRKTAEELLQLSNLVYQSSSEAMMVCDQEFSVLSINPAFTSLTGFELQEVVGRPPAGYRSGKHPKEFYSDMWSSLDRDGKWEGELWATKKNGDEFLKSVTINTIRDDAGAVYRFVILFSDITERRRTDDVIWRQANFDALTGLPNRRHILEILASMTSTSIDTDPFAVMILDLDGFKEINDTLGHDQGDLLLTEAARRLQSCLASEDVIGRLGGDEFLIVFRNTGGDLRSRVNDVSARILKEVGTEFEIGENSVYVSASLGVTFAPDDTKEVEVLLKNADQAMYAAKNAGRDQIAFFDASMHLSAVNRMQLANDLRRAILDEEFQILYQPIVELATLRVIKAEALIRWNHPTRGLVNPAEFIPIAEETGAIVDIGGWVFHQAVNQARQWRETHHSAFQVSVNVSPAQFRASKRSALSDRFTLNDTAVVGGSIVVEITEGLLLDASDAVNERLLAFRDAGIQVSLDDFGTGYSSLSYLKKFDIDYLKIDQSFVRNMTKGSDDLALCEAMIVMAHKLGMRVIAEGVETAEQRDLLIAAGCDFAQGYLFSRPVPALEMEAQISTENKGGAESAA